MSYLFYKILHVTAALTVFGMLGGVCLHVMNGGTREQGAGRALVMTVHGLGLLLVLVGGFGLLARLNIITDWPGWVWGKLVIWLLAGAWVALVYRRPTLARPMLILLPFLGLAVSWLAIAKPF